MQIRDAIVARAGLAGLCAARARTKAGVMVTLIDARPGAGGRVWTVRDGLRNGQHAELGGEFIDSDQNAIRQLVSEPGLELVRILTHGFTHRYRCDEDWCPGRTEPWDRLQESLRPLLTKYKAARGDTKSDTLATQPLTQRERGQLGASGPAAGARAPCRLARICRGTHQPGSCSPEPEAQSPKG